MSRTRRKRRARKTRRKRTQRGGETRRKKEEKKERKEEEKHRERKEEEKHKERKEEEKHKERKEEEEEEEEKDEHCKSGKNGCLACNDEGHCTACDIGYLRHEGSCKRMQKPSELKDKEDEMKEEMSDKVGESIKEKMSSHVPGMEGAEDAFGEVKGLGGTGMEGVEDIAGEVKGLGGTGIEGVEDIAGEIKGLGGGVTDMVSKAESKVMAGGEEAELEAAFEIVGLGPEDPLADACAALVAAGFTLTPKIKNLAEDGALPGVSWPKSNSLPSVGIPKLPFHMPHLHFPDFHMPHLHFPHFNIHIPKIFQFKRHPWLWPRDGQCPSPLPWNDPTASSYQDIPPDQDISSDPDVPPVQGGGRRRKRKTRRKTRRKKRRKTRRKKRHVRRKTRRR